VGRERRPPAQRVESSGARRAADAFAVERAHWQRSLMDSMGATGMRGAQKFDSCSALSQT